MYGKTMSMAAGKWQRPLSLAVQKRVARLHTAKGRQKTGLFLIEGFRLLGAAFEHGWPVESVIVCDDRASCTRLEELLIQHKLSNVAVYTAPRRMVEELAVTIQPSGIIALARQKPLLLLDAPPSGGRLLIADNIRDPGNLGAILRSAAAFGIEGVYLSTGSIDIYNPKVVRASMGALFVLPVYPSTDLRQLAKQLGRARFGVFIADPHEGRVPGRVRMPAKWALVIGGETEGYSDLWRESGAKPLRIPMSAKTESLNSAVAAGIILFCLGGPKSAGTSQGAKTGHRK